MVEHCDFDEQVHLARATDGHHRPDLVVRLAGGRSVVVDAKVPLDAQLDALATDDPEEQAAHLRRHVRQVRAHVDALAGKAYWRSLPGAPRVRGDVRAGRVLPLGRARRRPVAAGVRRRRATSSSPPRPR